MLHNPSAKPFLKWAGGKTQILDDLLRHIPDNYERYLEPMVGAGALFFRLQPRTAILADQNEELINAYRVVRDDVQKLISTLREFVNEEQVYYKVRAMDSDQLDPIERAARTIYLNKTCYNGLYRVNKKGQFNVPFGKRKNPTICDTDTLLAASDALQNVVLIAGNYRQTLEQYAKPNDFVYLDPPYHPTGQYADFKRYTKEFFYEEDHIELRDEVIRLVSLGCRVLLTNSYTDFVQQLYEGFDYEVIDTRRNISSDAKTRTGTDLIVIATRPPAKSDTTSDTVKLLDHFPGTRFMGSKYRILPFLWEHIRNLDFDTVLDAFSGSGCVSYMLKQRGKQVLSNDFMHFCYHISRGIVENNKTCLSKQEIDLLMLPNQNASTFIADTFEGLYFRDEENQFLDSLRANIDLLDSQYKRSLALAALARACIKRQPRGIFTFTGDRYNDGRRDLQMTLQEHFLENAHTFNGAVFDNGRNNMAYNCDIFEIDVNADLVYLDPPYYTPNSDNDYTRRYHFVEGLVRNWDGVEIQQDTVTKKFKRYETPFANKQTVYQAFEALFERFRNSIIVVSYSSNSIPDKTELVAMLKEHKKTVRVFQIHHLYSFGTHAHKVGNNANKVREFVFIAQ